LQSKTFYRKFPFSKTSFLGLRAKHMDTDEVVADLLADRDAGKARDMMLAWSEARTSTWADAERDAQMRAAYGGQVPQIRGQLRYHSGQKALVDSCQSVGLGAMPMPTTPGGATFTIGRVGRFALVSLQAKDRTLLPRRSITRKIMSQANEPLDPQTRLFEPQRVVTELAYFGCLVSIPSRDPLVPAELGFAVPNAGITIWLSWIPLHRLHGMLQSRIDGATGASDARGDDADIPDLVIPTFRVPVRPKKDEEPK
jgi:hypothetical protein